VTLVWSGLALGAVYALVAIGYNIVFLSSNTFNFAQAQLMMVGTFVAYTGIVTLRLPVLVVAVLAAVTVLLLAGLEERFAVRPVPDHQTQLVTTLGVATLLNGATQLVYALQNLVRDSLTLVAMLAEVLQNDLQAPALRLMPRLAGTLELAHPRRRADSSYEQARPRVAPAPGGAGGDPPRAAADRRVRRPRGDRAARRRRAAAGGGRVTGHR